MSMDDGPSIGELSRQVKESMERLKGIAERLENQFISKEYFNLFERGLTQTLNLLQEKANSIENTRVAKVEYEALQVRVADLEDGNKWMLRTILGIVISATAVVILAFYGLK